MGRMDTPPYSIPRVERWAVLNLRFLRSGWWFVRLRGQWMINRGPVVKRRTRRVYG